MRREREAAGEQQHRSMHASPGPHSATPTSRQPANKIPASLFFTQQHSPALCGAAHARHPSRAPSPPAFRAGQWNEMRSEERKNRMMGGGRSLEAAGGVGMRGAQARSCCSPAPHSATRVAICRCSAATTGSPAQALQRASACMHALHRPTSSTLLFPGAPHPPLVSLQSSSSSTARQCT